LEDKARTAAGAWSILSVHLKDVAAELGVTIMSAFGGDAGSGMAGLTSFVDEIKAHVGDLKPYFQEVAANAREIFFFFAAAWNDFGKPVVAQVQEWMARFGVSSDDLKFRQLDLWKWMAVGAAYGIDALKMAAGAVLTYGVAPWLRWEADVLDFAR